MTRVKRPVWILAALLASAAVALPAVAADGPTIKGVVVSVSSSAVAVKDARGVVTTCTLAPKSPSADGYSAGQAVQMQCVRAKGKLVLARLRHLPAPSATPTDEAKPVTFGGAITALSDSAISLHDGDRDLTCSIGASSPSTDGYAVGQHARVACLNGALVKIDAVTAPVNPPKPTGDPPHKTVGARGTLTVLSSSSITVHTDGGDVSCTVGDGSPQLGDFHVGDLVKMGCVDGKLVSLAKADAPAPPTTQPPTTQPPAATTAAGTITALSTTALTVHNDEHGDITCSLGPSSPRLGDYHLGDHVGIACADGALVKIVRLT